MSVAAGGRPHVFLGDPADASSWLAWVCSTDAAARRPGRRPCSRPRAELKWRTNHPTQPTRRPRPRRSRDATVQPPAPSAFVLLPSRRELFASIGRQLDSPQKLGGSGGCTSVRPLANLIHMTRRPGRNQLGGRNCASRISCVLPNSFLWTHPHQSEILCGGKGFINQYRVFVAL